MGLTIDGKAIAATVREEVRARVQRLAERGTSVGLATVLVGDDAASQTYVGSKQKACGEVGIRSFGHRLPATTTQAELLALVRELGGNRDVDGLHPVSQGRLMAGAPGLRPCTPVGVMRLLDEARVELKGARAVVIGRSLLVGKPVAFLLLERHATVTLCHSRTRDLGEEVGRADVVVAAAGQAGLVRGAWIRPGAVVIDVGMNRGADGKLCGDVEFAVARERAAEITPVPGGVGPMTVAMLLANTVTAAEWAAAARAA